MHTSVQNEMKKCSLWSTTYSCSAMNIYFMVCLVEILNNLKHIMSSFNKMLRIIISNRSIYVNYSFRFAESWYIFNIHKFSFHVSRSLKADDCSYTFWLQICYVFRTVDESSNKKIFCDCITGQFISKNIRLVIWVLNAKRFWDLAIKYHIPADSTLNLHKIPDKMVSNNLNSHINEESTRE